MLPPSCRAGAATSSRQVARADACIPENIDWRKAMEKDLVCGMQIDPAKAAGTSEYQGKTYYFCSKSCKTKFDANPSQYAK